MWPSFESVSEQSAAIGYDRRSILADGVSFCGLRRFTLTFLRATIS